jgi:hypothetical protein
MTDTSINPGVRGHTRSTWRDETHLRGVLLRLIAENQDAERDEIEAMYLAKCEMVPKLIEEALRRAFDNDWDGLHKRKQLRPGPTEKTIEEAKAKVEETKAKIEAAVEIIKATVLLDLVQPNGKKLRDCTGAEVRELQTQMPSWFKIIAARVKPAEVVGKVLSEAEVRKMWGK